MLQFSEDYFKSEYIDGFYVRESMKRYWAAQLEILVQIDEICKRHGIRYYAFYGTLLGAVRHKGFIPWDDDVDIAMTRIDHMRFTKYAKDEFKDGVSFYNMYEKAGIPTRVINNWVVTTEPDFLGKSHGCPFPAGIDIFILDNVPTDPEEDDLIRNIWVIGNAAAGGLKELAKENPDSNIKEEDVWANVDAFEEFTGQTLDRSGDLQIQIGVILDRLAASYYDIDSEYVAVMGYYYKTDSFGCKYRKECFKDNIFLPFENIMISAPAGYDEILTIGYKNYMKKVNCGASHNYPPFKEAQQMVKKRFEELNLPLPRAYDWEDEPGEGNAEE